MRTFLRETFAQRTLAEWSAFLGTLDVAWAPVKTLHEAAMSDLARERRRVVEEPAGQPHLGIPIKFTHEPGRIDPRLERLGESTAAVLATTSWPLVRRTV